MKRTNVDGVRNIALRIASTLHKLVVLLRDYIIVARNKTEIKPTENILAVMYGVSWLVYVFIVVWIFWWLRYVTVDSAKWALSAQVQATAAIFGLFIAAVSLLRHRITDQDQRLRNDIYNYLKDLAQTFRIPPMEVVDVAYADYSKWLTEAINKKEKIAKDAFRNLGRLWVIRFLSLQYRLRLRFGRYLTVGQTKELSKISRLSRESAINMWEYYYRLPEKFIIKMHETLDMVCLMLTGQNLKSGDSATLPEKCVRLNNVAYAIVYNDSKVIAENVNRTRRALRPPFYFISLVLAFAIVLGLCVLTGIEGTLLPPILSSPDNLKWVVGIPVGLSIFGIFLCLIVIRNII